MSDLFNKKFAEIFGKMDEKVLEARLNAAIDMLKKGNVDDLAKKLNKMDKDELLQKINELDENKLKSLNIDKNQIKQKINNADLDNLSSLLGDQGNEIVDKIKKILEQG